jgi:ribosomal protein S18 acetylase RimI-like enzyme
MKIKRLTPSDYDNLVTLWEKAGLSYRPRGRDSKKAIQEQIQESPDLFLGAYLEEELIGCVVASFDGRKGWINRLAVLPEYRRQGIAQTLIQATELALKRRGAEVTGVLIFETNEPSLALFQKMGFKAHEDIVYLSKRKSEKS